MNTFIFIYDQGREPEKCSLLVEVHKRSPYLIKSIKMFEEDLITIMKIVDIKILN